MFDASHEWRRKLLTTRKGHGQSGWSPIGCEGFHTNLNIPSPLPTNTIYFSLARSLSVTHMMISKIPAEVPASQVLAEGTRWITALFTARVASGTPKCNEWVVWKMLSCWLSPLANVESAFATTAHQHPSKSTRNNQRQTHTQDPWYHWIGLKENLRETLVFHGFPGFSHEIWVFLAEFDSENHTFYISSSKSLPQTTAFRFFHDLSHVSIVFSMTCYVFPCFPMVFPGFSHGCHTGPLASWAPGTCAAAAAAWPSLWNGPGRSSAPGLRREASWDKQRLVDLMCTYTYTYIYIYIYVCVYLVVYKV